MRCVVVTQVVSTLSPWSDYALVTPVMMMMAKMIMMTMTLLLMKIPLLLQEIKFLVE